MINIDEVCEELMLYKAEIFTEMKGKAITEGSKEDFFYRGANEALAKIYDKIQRKNASLVEEMGNDMEDDDELSN